MALKLEDISEKYALEKLNNVKFEGSLVYKKRNELFTYYDLQESFEDGFKMGTNSDWISVNEELPKELESVLVASQYEGEILFEVSFILNGKWKIKNAKPIAWMPIPKINLKNGKLLY